MEHKFDQKTQNTEVFDLNADEFEAVAKDKDKASLMQKIKSGIETAEVIASLSGAMGKKINLKYIVAAIIAILICAITGGVVIIQNIINLIMYIVK